MLLAQHPLPLFTWAQVSVPLLELDVAALEEDALLADEAALEEDATLLEDAALLDEAATEELDAVVDGPDDPALEAVTVVTEPPPPPAGLVVEDEVPEVVVEAGLTPPLPGTPVLDEDATAPPPWPAVGSPAAPPAPDALVTPSRSVLYTEHAPMALSPTTPKASPARITASWKP